MEIEERLLFDLSEFWECGMLSGYLERRRMDTLYMLNDGRDSGRLNIMRGGGIWFSSKC